MKKTILQHKKIKLFTTIIFFFFFQNLIAQCDDLEVDAGVDVFFCVGSSGVQLNGAATGVAGPYTYSWSPSSGLSCVNCANPIATLAGNYMLTVNGCTQEADTITVSTLVSPSANFNFSPNNTCANVPIQFTNTSTGNGLSFAWNFGDPTSANNASTVANPSHTFSAIGATNVNYNITLTVTNSNGCFSSIMQVVTVKPLPDATFQDYSSNFVNCSGQNFDMLLEINSSTLSTNSNYAISWGDGSASFNSTTFPPNGLEHSYTSLGYFNLISTVTGINGCVSTQSYSVYNGGNPAVGLGNPGSTVNLCLPQSLTFPITGTQNNPPGTIYIVTSNTGQPPVTFNHPPPANYTQLFTATSCGAVGANNPNSFFIRIRAENPCGFSESTVEPVTTSTRPQAEFTISPNTIVCTNSAVTFTNTSINGVTVNANLICNSTNPLNWSILPAIGWTISSGALGNALPTANPSTWGSNALGVLFNTPGNYSITMILRNSCGNDTITKTVCVESPLIPQFVLNNNLGCTPLAVTATNTTNITNSCPGNPNYQWNVAYTALYCGNGTPIWNYTNGTNASSANPSFNFVTPGVYSITLTTTNSCGTVTSAAQTVTVKKPPTVSISPIPSLCLGATVTPIIAVNACSNLSLPTNPSAYLWTANGASPSSSTSSTPPTFSYATPGTYTISLSVTNECGTTTASVTFTINTVPTTTAESNLTFCPGDIVPINNFISTPSGATFIWNNSNTAIGLAASGISSVPSFTATNNTAAPITSTISIAPTLGSCVGSTISYTITVNPRPVILPEPSLIYCSGAIVPLNSFISSPSGAAFTWTNSNTSIGLALTSGTADIPSFTATNASSSAISSTISVSPILAGCPGATISYLITINPLPIVLTEPDLTYCPGVLAPSNVLASTPSGATYTWTNSNIAIGLAASGTANIPSFNTTNASANSISSIISITPTLSGCSGTPLNYSIAISPFNTISAGTSQTVCINSAINNISLTTTGATGATVTGLPTGVIGSWLNNVFTISGTPTVSGTFNYTVTTTGGCPPATATGTIIVNINTIAPGISQSVCQNVPISNISLTTTGATGATFAGLPAGLTGAWSGNVALISGTPSVSGVFNYTVTTTGGCPPAITTGSVTVISLNTIATGSNQTICQNVPILNISLATTGATGATFSGLPTGVTGQWSGNAVAISGTPTQSGTFNYTATTTGGCPPAIATGTITVTPSNTISAGTNQTVCINAAITNVVLTTTGATGATFSGLPAGVAGSWIGNVATISGTPTQSGTFNYTVTTTGGCPASIATGSITVIPSNTITVGLNRAVCINSPISNIGLTTTVASGASFTGLPLGVTGSWAGNIATISGTPTQSGTFNYTVTTTGGCPSASTIGTITVSPLNTITAGTNQTVCQNTAISNISLTTTGATGATVTGLPTGVIGSWLNNIFTISGTPTQSGTYNYIVTTTGGCPPATATGTIIVNINTIAPGISQSVCVNNAITNINLPTTLATGATFSGLPAGVTGQWNADLATISGTPTESGIFNYSVTTTGGCLPVSAAGTITVNSTNTIAAGTNQTICINSLLSPISLATTSATGATFSNLPAGVTGQWSGNIATISGTPTQSGTFNYTVTTTGGCPTATTFGAITVTPANTISAGTNQTVCVNTALTNISLSTTGATGATVTGLPAGLSGVWSNNIFTISGIPTQSGTFTYIVTTTGGCPPAATTGTIIVNLNTILAGSNQTVCTNSAIASIILPTTIATGATFFGLPTGVTGQWSGNTVTISGTPIQSGTYNYSVTTTGGCPTAITSGTIIVNAYNTISQGVNETICINSAIPTISLSTTGATGATFSGLPAGVSGQWSGNTVTISGAPIVSGSYSYVVTTNGGCPPALTSGLITVTPSNTISVGVNQSVCINSAITNISLSTTGATGATVTGLPTGVIGSWSNNVFVISGTPTVSGTFNYIVTTTGGCPASVSSGILTVNQLPFVNAGIDLVLCNQPIGAILTGSPSGGIWTGSGITNSVGEFTPTTVGIFPIIYTVTNQFGCINSDTLNVSVIPATLANAGPNQEICINSPSLQVVGGPIAGTWSGTGITAGGIFTPNTAGNFPLVYTVGSGTCLTRDTMIFTVHPLPIVNAGPDFSICQNGSSVSLNGFPVGGTWSGNGLTGSVFSPIGLAIGTHTLTYSYTNPVTNCSSSDQLVVTILLPPAVNAGVDQTLCNQPIAVSLSGTPLLGLWSGTGITAAGIFTPNGNGVFTLTYSFLASNGCSNFDNIDITVISPTLANAGPNQEICINSPSLQVVGGPIAGTWSGTGITAAGIFTPNTAGNFTLVYTVGSGTCLTRDTMIFTVHPLPIVDAGPDVSICISAAPIDFTGTPAGGSWSGPGITNVIAGTFNPTLLAAGTYPIVYTYINPTTTCLNTNTLIVTVRPLPVPNFIFNPIVCTNVSESFTNTSLLGNTYSWDFNDGGTSILPSPSHTFTTTGFPEVQLIVTSAFGCVDSISNIVEVQEPPQANFTLTPASSCAPAIVNFTNLSSIIAPVYSWDFGNGQTSTLQNPASQTYFQSVFSDTTYYIELVVTNFCGSSTYTENVVVTPSPTAVFGTNLDFGCSPFTLQIANVSLGLPDSFYWDFGDGTTSTDPSPFLSHVFTTGVNDTVYTIMLVATNECGVDTSYYDITVYPNVVTAFFNTDYISGCAPLSVEFTQYSVGANVYNWDFGDFNSSNTYNTSHVYTQAGTYTVSLIVTDGCSYDTATIEIVVIEPPFVDFVSAPDSVCINQPFIFTNLSTGSLSSTDWDFGDGATSVTTNTQHAYSASGTYMVTLTGTSTINTCTTSVTKPVVVRVNPVAAFAPNPLSGCVPLTVSFANLSTNSNFQTWDFGDGNFSTQFSPTHTFTSVGAFVVKLLVQNTNGCLDSISKVINVYPVPTANFTVNSASFCTVPIDIATTNLSIGAVNYNWNFGNGNFSNLTNPVITYSNAGTYTIQLTASNAYGCSDSHSFTVNIYGTPVADFIISRDTICLGETINFISQSINADSVVWYVGDGNTFTGNTFPYQYVTAGVYDITAIAFGPGGCSDTLTLINGVVVNPKPIAGFDYVNQQDPEPLSGTIEFTNTSIGATDYLWHFGNAQSSTEFNPIYRYNTYGDFLAELIVTNQFGCKDTIEQIIIVQFFSGLFVPNAIYPDHPAFGVANFLPVGIGLATYEVLIYDDWGNLIWESRALDAQGRPIEYWDGRFNGERVQQDAYVWKITATFINTKAWRGKEYEGGIFRKSGTVTVIR
jgi:PKD repeat protein